MPATATAPKVSTTRKSRSTTAAKKETSKPEVKTVEATFTLEKLPSGKGGVRFKEDSESPVLGQVYVSQDVFAKLGEPGEIAVTVSVA